MTAPVAAIVADTCERGFAEVSFLGGYEVYKNNFARERRNLQRFQAVSGRIAEAALPREIAACTARRQLPGRRYANSPGR